MKNRSVFKAGLFMLATTGLIQGCANMDTANMMELGSSALQVAMFSDQEARSMANEACQQMDAQAKVAPASHAYSQRLNRVMAPLGSQINGVPLNHKVYLDDEVNAWAMANGCIRVYSGIMDKMNDNELQGVLGHEIGHVALGHSKKRMQTAYAASLARQTAASSGNSTLASLSASEAGALGEAFINAQFSQSQESAADNFSFDLLTEKKLDRTGLVTAFEKMAAMGGNQSSLLSSHPASDKRAQNMRTRLNASQ